MSATSDGGRARRAQLAVTLGAQESCRSRRSRQRPIVVEIGDDRLHERLRQRDRALLVAQVIEQDRERELLRAFALIGPLEAVFGEPLDLVVLVERLPSTVTTSPSMVRFPS